MQISSKKGEWFEIIVPSDWNGISTEHLFWNVWNAPKKLTHQFRTNKEVTVNGSPANWHEALKTGDRLRIKLFSEVEFGVTPTYMDLEILFEDEHLLIVNKPAGVNTHPNSPEDTDTLANGVAFHLQANGESRQVKHIHRLDRDTSGAILFAKHALAGSILDKMLEERKIKRTYVALVEGKIRGKKGTINEPIGRDRHHPTKRRVSPNGQQAITHYQVIESSPDFSKVKCQLETGRTHQIRVHFSHIGHPLIGDKLYNENPSGNRLALHAEQLQLTHPLTFEKIDVVCPVEW
ncbi:RluA family pseudouridine synthase [Robertmurraya yapensis]|uniref:Pseudouridine synthase n=2 Tax=Bacillaceae TaxID=186817 RepID=A0A3S0KCU0_9BACI|nr:RluA family pseudouridine synthase [Bacillus yapensis]RTR27888.1 RluA family pseudouridine synthase [Bacillus yapensis]TKS94291.1 RluA family pseudouridine synthase [Bacillus yapensis]